MGTFVLLHGAYQGGWIFQPVAARLGAAGHRTYRPTLDGCGERRSGLRAGITTESHGAEVADLLFYEDLRDVTLVGTSSGGMVLCRAAELARERVGRVVFVDALALRDGERIADFVQRPTATTTELATGPSEQDARTRLFGDLDAELRDWALARYTMHPRGPMEEPVRLERFWDLPWSAQVIYCTRSVNPPEAHQRRTAAALGASWAELDTGHYPMLSMPDELAELLIAGA
ncbi:MAG: alpha/beta hydrolase [Acidimicrobiia bacterium]|nr:alpha/beta hydrolase [Acidimicrobiia bacterium]